MVSYSVAEAEHSLPSLIDKAASGETVVITRHGKPVAELRAPSSALSSPEPSRKAASGYEWLIARRDQRPGMDITSVDLLNQVDDES